MHTGLFARLTDWIAPRPSGAEQLPGNANGPHRDAWVREQLSALPAGWRLLDAGAGEMPYKLDCSHLRYVSTDFGAYEGHGDGAGLQTGDFCISGVDHLCDILEIPEPAGSFDAVLCTEVLEHVPDPVAALTSLSALIRPGGRLLLTAPFSSMAHFTPHYYCTGFSSYFWHHHLERLGFDDIQLFSLGNLHDITIERLSRSRQFAIEHGCPPPGRLQALAISIVCHLVEQWAAADRASVDSATMGWMIRANKRDPSDGARPV